MNIIIILQLQEQMIVIKMKTILLLITLHLALNINAQSPKDDYILLDKVLKEHFYNKKEFKKDTKLKTNSNNSLLQSYYKYKYHNDKTLKLIGVKYDENNKKKPDYYTEEIQDKFRRDWYSKYDTLSKLFSEKDFKILLKKNNKKWKKNKTIKLFSKKRDVKYETISVAKPYYSLNGKYALIQCIARHRSKSIIVYRKENDIWILNNIIENIF